MAGQEDIAEEMLGDQVPVADEDDDMDDEYGHDAASDADFAILRQPLPSSVIFPDISELAQGSEGEQLQIAACEEITFFDYKLDQEGELQRQICGQFVADPLAVGPATGLSRDAAIAELGIPLTARFLKTTFHLLKQCELRGISADNSDAAAIAEALKELRKLVPLLQTHLVKAKDGTATLKVWGKDDSKEVRRQFIIFLTSLDSCQGPVSKLPCMEKQPNGQYIRVLKRPCLHASQGSSKLYSVAINFAVKEAHLNHLRHMPESEDEKAETMISWFCEALMAVAPEMYEGSPLLMHNHVAYVTASQIAKVVRDRTTGSLQAMFDTKAAMEAFCRAGPITLGAVGEWGMYSCTICAASNASIKQDVPYDQVLVLGHTSSAKEHAEAAQGVLRTLVDAGLGDVRLSIMGSCTTELRPLASAVDIADRALLTMGKKGKIRLAAGGSGNLRAQRQQPPSDQEVAAAAAGGAHARRSCSCVIIPGPLDQWNVLKTLAMDDPESSVAVTYQGEHLAVELHERSSSGSLGVFLGDPSTKMPAFDRALLQLAGKMAAGMVLLHGRAGLPLPCPAADYVKAADHVLAVHAAVESGRSHEVDPLPAMIAAKKSIFKLCGTWLENPIAYSRASDPKLKRLFADSDSEGEEEEPIPAPPPPRDTSPLLAGIAQAQAFYSSVLEAASKRPMSSQILGSSKPGSSRGRQQHRPPRGPSEVHQQGSTASSTARGGGGGGKRAYSRQGSPSGDGRGSQRRPSHH